MTYSGAWHAAGLDPFELLRRPGNLGIVLQPIVDLRPRGRLLYGVECLSRGPGGTPLEDARALFELVRMRDAELRVDRLCIEEALRTAALLPQVPRFSVNLHARTLAEDPGFLQFFAEALARHGITPRILTIDLIAPRQFSPPLLDALQQLRALGVLLAVDEVGLGYTDYDGLFKARPEFVKVDRAFIRRAPGDNLRDLMLDSVVRLARGMDAQTVAEGVETLEELDAATAHGIQLVQGHFFGEPMGAAGLARTGLLTQEEPRAA